MSSVLTLTGSVGAKAITPVDSSEIGGVTMDQCWPIGSVFLSVVSTDPATLLGIGTWAALAAGRMLVGYNSGDADFDTAEETGGSKTSAALLAHTHSITDPTHNHAQNSHNHTQDSHNHTQNSFAPRIINSGTAGTVGVQGASAASNASASNSATTATNQAATATNQAATATNQAASTGITGTDSTGSGSSFPNMPPYLVVYMWKRTA